MSSVRAGGAYLPIGEFAHGTGLTASALRHYESCGLLVPAAVATTSGYRYYGSWQIPVGRLINSLRAAGLPIDALRRAIEHDGRDAGIVIDAHLAAMEARLENARHACREATQWAAEVSAQATRVDLDGRLLATALDQVLPAAPSARVAKERGIPAGVLLEISAGFLLRLVATDAHRLALKEITPLAVAGAVCRVVHTTQGLVALRTAIGTGPGIVTARVCAGWVEWRVCDQELKAAAVNQPFPPFESRLGRAVSPTARHSGVVFSRSRLLDVVASFGTKTPVRIEIGPRTMRLSAGSGDEDEIEIEHLGRSRPLVAAYDPRYLRDALAALPGPYAAFSAMGPTRPALIRTVLDDAFLTVVMPIKMGGRLD